MIVMALFATGVGLVSAKMSVSSAVRDSETREQMLRFLIRETYWLTAAIFVLYYFGLVDTFVIGMFKARMIWLLTYDYNSLLKNFDALKKST